MLIEQFDTGLKSKKDTKDINLSPKENYKNSTRKLAYIKW